MIRKSLHDYIFSQQDENDVFTKYRKHRERTYEALTAEHVKEILLPAAAAALQKEISKIFNSR